MVDSFKPVFQFEAIKGHQLWWRGAVLIGFVSFIYWAYTQPTEFDDFVKGQKEFVDDLVTSVALCACVLCIVCACGCV